ncbi:MarR family transcriptional regulator [Methanosarcina hadiensis]|uniref:helix-turn-helix transcriptional regulator n=1 Tax=Methanosarcina hadiensis TaxID=3078083 RepID=UPI0039777CC8
MVQMNPRYYLVCIGILLASGLPGLASGLPEPASGLPFLEEENTTAATVHGATYAWDSLEPINDTVIEVNSNPPQSIVAKNGTYSFDLMPGDYTITARYYRNNTLIYSEETTIKIEGEGSYVLDLLLYPVSENRKTETTAFRKNQNGINPPEQTEASSSVTSYLPVAFLLLILFAGSYKLSSRHKFIKEKRSQKKEYKISGILENILCKITYSGTKPEFKSSKREFFASDPIIEPGDISYNSTDALKKQPLSTELSEILDIIRGNKGRITQKELRGRLKYSEVKVSLLLSELEKREMIKKFKNGRENIIVLIEERV